ncbi:energy-coupling factor ABC transporter ATP-binding protein [Lentilactobacillus kosonis]|uniref:ABC transporter ATP-binding protein n=1 Tax=Lentilactobacillus kosonis TaxID=2810561 RepID=A0A401FMV5_9LACO|nr:ATP-binding cassette domain-containing protein [Lentilactobacillus kosonis]GAY73646.1 ATPase component CbiO of energizing module of cobalt ECF transporter [Lentilactobacillus kosonis]
MIEFKNVEFSYEKGAPILKDINLKLGDTSEEVIGILGPNGAGKSTMFLNLVGMLKPTKGEILVDDQPIKYSKRGLNELRRKIGIVFQNSDQQIFYSIVQDDITFALHNLGVEESIIQERLQQVLIDLDIVKLKDRPVQYLSGGQKKRVAIAGILILNSEWILLDEPTAGLDPDGKQRMVKLIALLKSKGQKIIVSSHDMDFMYEVCDHFHILQDGQIVKSGTKDSVFRDEGFLKLCKLEQPWLVRIHEKLGLPLFANEQEFNQFNNLAQTTTEK